MPSPTVMRIGPNLHSNTRGTCVLWLVGDNLDKTKTYYVCADGKRWKSINCGDPIPTRSGRHEKMMIRLKYDGVYDCGGTHTTPRTVPYSDDDFAALTITVTNGPPPTSSDTPMPVSDESLVEGSDDA